MGRQESCRAAVGVRGRIMSKHNVTALVPRSDAIFKNICDMEEETSAINNLVNALAMICVSDDIDEPLGSTLQYLTFQIRDNLQAIEERRCKLFELAHPKRAHFERVGWPSAEPASG